MAAADSASAAVLPASIVEALPAIVAELFGSALGAADVDEDMAAHGSGSPAAAAAPATAAAATTTAAAAAAHASSLVLPLVTAHAALLLAPLVQHAACAAQADAERTHVEADGGRGGAQARMPPPEHSSRCTRARFLRCAGLLAALLRCRELHPALLVSAGSLRAAVAGLVACAQQQPQLSGDARVRAESVRLEQVLEDVVG